MVKTSLFIFSSIMDYEIESNLSDHGLGSLIHNLLPDSLHIDPYDVTTSPSPLLTQKTIWAFDCNVLYCNQLEELNTEDEENVEDSFEEETRNEENQENLIEEVEEIDFVGQQEGILGRNQTYFSQLFSRIYTSSIFVDPSLISRNDASRRANWELFHRFLQLVEANKKRTCASSTFLHNLRTVDF